MPTPKKTPTIRDPADQFQRDARNVISGLSNCPILQGVLLTGVELTTNTKKVTHGLGRVPKGWFVVDKTVVTDVTRDSTQSDERHLFLHLRASVAATVSIWVF